MNNCIIIGGGIIGLCSAYFLQKEGHQVTVLDQSNMDNGASYVNAGYISPSHIIPLSAPGVVKKGLKWMFDPSSPFYIKPRFEMDFLKWAWAFNKSCNASHEKKVIPLIRDISLLSMGLYNEIKTLDSFDFHYDKKGLLMLYQTEKMMEEERRVSEIVRDAGMEAINLNESETKKLEPNSRLNIKGATLYGSDGHTTPHEFMENMKDHLKAAGVQILSSEKVLDIHVKKNRIMSLTTNKGNYEGDEFVLAAGSWTGLISKKLGIQVLLQAGKGYRINVSRPTGISYPAILAESKAAVTPMNGFTRFAGTMEIAGISSNVNKIRVDAIAKAISRYYPEVHISAAEKNEASSGLRPVSPDGLPFIGRSEKCANLTIATGHAMMGWTMATGTGKLVSEIISDKQLSMNIDAFHPDRKF